MLLSNFHTTGSPECYISETYNYLINKDMKIIPYFINSNQYLPLGTQKDLDTFLGKAGEFSKNNPGTIICDIDAQYFSININLASSIHRIQSY